MSIEGERIPTANGSADLPRSPNDRHIERWDALTRWGGLSLGVLVFVLLFLAGLWGIIAVVREII